ncbi:MAG: hypothetical protein NXY57DRAFT_603618 [Lentinula lateritia]|uniref:Cupin 2 conserved barrel domain-containing protein n=1 Tax=Lentinula lateritia TaxID=40482 RepID=A0ABQ8VVE9_9AGAR|nr:MAG: hypothetical protein NXY57DRAFT_603618 [Lentinula lateritia]KAJ4500315.1 hypothetical protein C8R41DRAFT_481631 [Lentinula lateritia]
MSFLFPKHPLQTPKRDPDGAWNFFDGALKTWAVKSDGNSFTSRQIFKYGNPHTGVGRKSTATPPYHWHIYQTERFDVHSGVLCYDLDGKEGKLVGGESVTIPPHHYHTFWLDPESGVDLDVHITVSGGPNAGFDDTFIHNFYGYLSSCVMQNHSPSPFQMLAFLDHADVVLVDFPLWTGRLANIVLGRWLGRGLGGYQVEYKEFDEKTA